MVSVNFRTNTCDGMFIQSESIKDKRIRRIVLWALVTVYTLLLPHANTIYRVIETHFSSRIAGKVPLAIILIFGLVYMVSIIKMQKGLKSWLFLLPCTFIVYVFLRLEPNPNKHIHIPEYIVMAWLLFEALSLDYKGQGIFYLVLICSGMLGVMDELMQGILPGRYYGWHDMVINLAAAVVGIFSLAGLKTLPSGEWTWIRNFRPLTKMLVINLGGAVGAVFTCVYLFEVKATLTFWGTYPSWLLLWNGLFIVAGLIVICYSALSGEPARSTNHRDSNRIDRTVTARLWTFCPLVILIAMHSLAVFTALSGLTFS